MNSSFVPARGGSTAEANALSIPPDTPRCSAHQPPVPALPGRFLAFPPPIETAASSPACLFRDKLREVTSAQNTVSLWVRMKTPRNNWGG